MCSRVTCKGKRHGVRGVGCMRSAVLVDEAHQCRHLRAVQRDGHEHTAGEDPHHVSSKAVGRPIYCILECATTFHHDTLSLDVSVRTLVGLHGQHHADVFLSRKRVAKIFTGFSKHSLVLMFTGKRETVWRTGSLGMPLRTSPCRWPSLGWTPRLVTAPKC